MFISKHQDLQKTLIGEIVFDNDFHRIQKIHEDVKNDDVFFNYAKIYKIKNVLSNILYICVTCDALKSCHLSFSKERN